MTVQIGTINPILVENTISFIISDVKTDKKISHFTLGEKQGKLNKAFLFFYYIFQIFFELKFENKSPFGYMLIITTLYYDLKI